MSKYPEVIMLDPNTGRVFGCGYGDENEMTCGDCAGGNGACGITREVWRIRTIMPDPYAALPSSTSEVKE